MHDILTVILSVLCSVLGLACLTSPLYAIGGIIAIFRRIKLPIFDIFLCIFSIPTAIIYYTRWLVDENIAFSKSFEFCGLIGAILIIVACFIIEPIRNHKMKKRQN